MRPPFITVNRPERGGAHDLEALTLDVLDLCCLKDPVKYANLCRAARRRGVTLKEYVMGQVRDLLATSIIMVPPNQTPGNN